MWGVEILLPGMPWAVTYDLTFTPIPEYSYEQTKAIPDAYGFGP